MLRPAIRLGATLLAFTLAASTTNAQLIDVEGQPLAANVQRLLKALDDLGQPLAPQLAEALKSAAKKQDAKRLQELLDPHVLLHVHLNPEARVKVKRGDAPALLQQGGFTPFLVKVHNESTVTKPLRVASPQALPIFSGAWSRGKVEKITEDDLRNRFLDLELYKSPPMTDKLSGLQVEYAIVLIHSSRAGEERTKDGRIVPRMGKLEATIIIDVGQGTQDLGSRGEVPILFDVKPALRVRLLVGDFDGRPTTGRFTFKDKNGRVYPPKAKRLAPDFFFQDQIYRPSGSFVLLPPGEFTMTYGRGPEYRQRTVNVVVPEVGEPVIAVKLERWINPMDYGFYSGDHHIHAAGCAHYTNPTEGVFAEDMFLHVKGEGLNVGCNLTWGPCFEFQRQFFEPEAHRISEPFTVLKYDIEVSGFGSQALGHVCLLNLRDQTYPGSEGTKTKGWPTWTTPLMRWAKNQRAYTGYAHSANGLGINPEAAAERLLAQLELLPQRAKAEKESKEEFARIEKEYREDLRRVKFSERRSETIVLPLPYEEIDLNNDGFITWEELVGGHRKATLRLPNYAIPEMNGIGAQEICVTTAQGLCDFISAMDTNRVPEWNCWYHILNCGFPLKVSGETDFPCITDSRVGQGRVYVQMGKIDKIEFKNWAEGLATGRSYISDGYAHALQFSVDGKVSGEKLKLAKPGKVNVKARVAFAAEMPLGTAQGGQVPKGPERAVELIVNGQVAATVKVQADDKEYDIEFKDVPIEQSSWVALRHFPQMHTNPVEVIVDHAPIRVSRKSALWCVGMIEQLWRVRRNAIAEEERAEAERVFDWAIQRYRKIAQEAPPGS
jgi:hypothetical protein